MSNNIQTKTDVMLSGIISVLYYLIIVQQHVKSLYDGLYIISGKTDLQRKQVYDIDMILRKCGTL